MKKIYYLFVFLVIATNFSFAQTNKIDKKELYPDKYTFEKAEEFIRNNNLENACWFFINLFPDNKSKVIERVKELAVQLDTVEIDQVIQKSFAINATFDPAVGTIKNGAMSVDGTKLKQKGAWADELIKSIPINKENRKLAKEFNKQGIEKVKKGDYKAAIEDFNKAIELKPGGQFYFNRAYAKSMMDDFNGAIADYDKAIEMKYRLPEAYYERGYCKDQLKNYKDAMEDYSKTIENNPSSAAAYNNRAFDKFMLKDYKAAIKDFDDAIILDSKITSAYVNRGYAKFETGDKAGACVDWKKALELGYKEADDIIKKNCQ